MLISEESDGIKFFLQDMRKIRKIREKSFFIISNKNNNYSQLIEFPTIKCAPFKPFIFETAADDS